MSTGPRLWRFEGVFRRGGLICAVRRSQTGSDAPQAPHWLPVAFAEVPVAAR